MKNLVVYFSATGTTQKVAKNLAKANNFDLFEIIPKQKYTNQDLDWTNKNSRSSLEMKNLNYRPEIANKIDNLKDYKNLFLGFPIWWYREPAIIDTFLEQYDFSNIANTSNIYLDSFKWKDFLPTDYIRLTEIVTGTWNQDITYSITYKTNLNEEERILAENLNSKENHKIDCTNIGLQEGEYITEFSFNFGKVDIGFKEENAPSIFCKVLDTVEDKDTFTNKTKTEGEYEDLKDEESDEWTTVVYEKDIHAEKLPKTGN